MKSFYLKLWPILLISSLGAIVYSNSFFCSFQFDDKIFIIDNQAIRSLMPWQHIWSFMPCRFLTFLSLSLNYHFHGLDVVGYHVVNLLIHLASATFVWWFVLLTLTTPALKENKISRQAPLIALLAALVFVSHPLQTESVTYIWQRATCLATLFYLASLSFYAKFRLLQDTKSKSNLWAYYYIGSLVTAMAAMFTKEITITLPLMILLYEYSFLKTKKNFNWKYLYAFLGILFIIPLTILLTHSGTAPKEPSTITPMHYLLTQFRVVMTYIRLVFLPFNQNVDYDYSVSKSIFEWPVLLSMASLIAILYGAKRLFSKYRLLSFSIFWFFLTLLPESSFLSLQDVIFEHRLYLPLVGYSLFLISGAYYSLEKNNFKTAVKFLIVIIACYSCLTYQRNKIWKDEISLWSDAVQKSPHKERPFNNRGLVYGQQENLTAAIADFTHAIEINPRYTNAYINRGFMYNREGKFDLALADYDKALEINPKLAEAYVNRGNVYDKEGNSSQALSDYNKAIATYEH